MRLAVINTRQKANFLATARYVYECYATIQEIMVSLLQSDKPCIS